MKTSPTQRTLKHLRDLGYTVQVVERWCQFSRRRKDLFSGIDVLAIRKGETLGVQATSGTNHSARVAKLRAEPQLRDWVNAGNILEVWSWAKRGERGKRKTWTVRRERIEYFIEPAEPTPTFERQTCSVCDRPMTRSSKPNYILCAPCVRLAPCEPSEWNLYPW